MVFADIDYVYVGSTVGFSSVNDSPSFGFNTAYQYMAELDNNFYLGINTHADLNMQFYDKTTEVSAGAIVGPSLGYSINPTSFLVATIAPAAYVETGDKEYVGIGLGGDLNYSYFFGTDNSFGITIGATSYLMFAELTDSNTKRNFIFDCVGYIGFTFRSGDYTGKETIFYNIF